MSGYTNYKNYKLIMLIEKFQSRYAAMNEAGEQAKLRNDLAAKSVSESEVHDGV
ncbi:hypothetical protein [Sediminibacillus albus]|uniref:Uncharacterized protein n=1 Tax=Sediminibacillus albus TaxID=407036 RepID=A0A1G9B261_9BACI|nr:hypothetical protein [Sediminibacillus albus]SDK33649.1 hypothetical protein SAMN05216243_2774 [Sediminibacillus albus]